MRREAGRPEAGQVSINYPASQAVAILGSVLIWILALVWGLVYPVVVIASIEQASGNVVNSAKLSVSVRGGGQQVSVRNLPVEIQSDRAGCDCFNERAGDARGDGRSASTGHYGWVAGTYYGYRCKASRQLGRIPRSGTWKIISEDECAFPKCQISAHYRRHSRSSTAVNQTSLTHYPLTFGKGPNKRQTTDVNVRAQCSLRILNAGVHGGFGLRQRRPYRLPILSNRSIESSFTLTVANFSRFRKPFIGGDNPVGLLPRIVHRIQLFTHYAQLTPHGDPLKRDEEQGYREYAACNFRPQQSRALEAAHFLFNLLELLFGGWLCLSSPRWLGSLNWRHSLRGFTYLICGGAIFAHGGVSVTQKLLDRFHLL